MGVGTVVGAGVGVAGIVGLWAGVSVGVGSGVGSSVICGNWVGWVLGVGVTETAVC